MRRTRVATSLPIPWSDYVDYVEIGESYIPLVYIVYMSWSSFAQGTQPIFLWLNVSGTNECISRVLPLVASTEVLRLVILRTYISAWHLDRFLLVIASYTCSVAGGNNR